MRVINLLPCLRSAADLQQHIDRNATTEKQTSKEVELQDSTSSRERGGIWLQIIAAISASFAVMACGGYLGWTSPALPHLLSTRSSFPVTVQQASWIASLYTLGGIFGSLLSPLMVDRLGRKLSLLAFAMPQLAGWGLIIGAHSYPVLYVARLVAGISHGGIYNVAVIYLAEIADKDIRGAFGTMLKMCTNLGGLFVTSLGAYLTYDQLNVASLSLPVIFVATFVFMPESPYFYLIQHREEEAVRSLMRLRRVSNAGDVIKDVAIMREAVLAGQRSGRSALRELVSDRGNRRGLWILLSLKVTQQLSGHMAIVAYTQEIFGHSESALKPQYAVIVLGVAQLAAGLAAAGLIDRLGRRVLVLFSGVSAALALALVGLFFFLKYSLRADVSTVTWLPVAALVLYEIMVALGIGTIPYVILGEIFPTNVKGPAVASGIIIGSVFAFVVGLGFHALNQAAGIHTTFWFFSGCCAAGTTWVYMITPETKGKTLEEIQVLFNPNKKKDVESNAAL
ncbi:facilitated trehalose transporter Tret1-like isoform X2 [Phymastichus coffea]|uniref:facilitated trehalose transporter Tret1-like isoform X2 n=1 Tax=Phymastichus coffea TaxID=108790 RepID=UPI00273C5241|nr:facilitated trehalose transporter Tret1-like isoform X2 [Phymastichus coffea]